MWRACIQYACDTCTVCGGRVELCKGQFIVQPQCIAATDDVAIDVAGHGKMMKSLNFEEPIMESSTKKIQLHFCSSSGFYDDQNSLTTLMKNNILLQAGSYFLE